MRAGDLARELMKRPDIEVWCGAWNGHVDTYAVVDHIFKFKYDAVSNDFFGTPGRMDKRLFRKGQDEVFYIGSRFGKVPNPEVDLGDDNIDYEISKINGEKGDPDLVWKLNEFKDEGNGIWSKEGDGWKITYNTEDQTLDVQNYRESMRFVGKVIGIETLRNIVDVCKLDLKIWT